MISCGPEFVTLGTSQPCFISSTFPSENKALHPSADKHSVCWFTLSSKQTACWCPGLSADSRYPSVLLFNTSEVGASLSNVLLFSQLYLQSETHSLFVQKDFQILLHDTNNRKERQSALWCVIQQTYLFQHKDMIFCLNLTVTGKATPSSQRPFNNINHKAIVSASVYWYSVTIIYVVLGVRLTSRVRLVA